MERENFEDSWKQAFEKAEIAPSGNTWTNIELELERAKGGKLKKKLVFFQLLAAASVVFLLGIGAGVFVMKNSYDESMRELAQLKVSQEKLLAAANSEDTQRASTKSQTNASTELSATLTESDDKTSTIILKDNNTIAKAESKSISKNGASELTITENADQARVGVLAPDRNASLASINTDVLPVLVEQRKVELITPQEASSEMVDPVQVMLARLEQREREVRAEDKSSKKRNAENEKLWTSVGFAAGSYNKMNGGYDQKIPDQSAFNMTSSGGALKQANSIIEKEAKASGVSYSVGANLGTKISERWVVQGGINYLTQSAAYTSKEVIQTPNDNTTMSFRPPSVKEIDRISASSDAVESNLASTPPYNVNNSLRYLSIPMQAGFLIINRKLGFQLNAGVSTDLFLQNTVSAEGAGLTKTNDGIGDKSSYRSFNLSGLAGTELSYRFSKNYRIALNPGIRYPFSSIYRADAVVSSTPFTFDIGVRFRYIFR